MWNTKDFARVGTALRRLVGAEPSGRKFYTNTDGEVKPVPPFPGSPAVEALKSWKNSPEFLASLGEYPSLTPEQRKAEKYRQAGYVCVGDGMVGEFWARHGKLVQRLPDGGMLIGADLAAGETTGYLPPLRAVSLNESQELDEAIVMGAIETLKARSPRLRPGAPMEFVPHNASGEIAAMDDYYLARGFAVVNSGNMRFEPLKPGAYFDEAWGVSDKDGCAFVIARNDLGEIPTILRGRWLWASRTLYVESWTQSDHIEQPFFDELMSAPRGSIRPQRIKHVIVPRTWPDFAHQIREKGMSIGGCSDASCPVCPGVQFPPGYHGTTGRPV